MRVSMNPKARITVGCVLAVLPAFTLYAGNTTVWFVDDDGAPGNGCTNWSDACADLQTALGLVGPGDQIWVAAGIYKPDQGGGQTPGDRQATFQLISGVALYGGFAGNENTLLQRAELFDQTVLSGDLAGDDLPVSCISDSPDCDDLGNLCGNEGFCIISDNTAENSYNVVNASVTDSSALLDGFTITAGNANGGCCVNNRGAGIYNMNGSPTVTNCTLSGNSANVFGGAMWYSFGNPSFTDCTFNGNWSGNEGGGVYLTTNLMSDLTNCTFSSNFSSRGGGISINASGPTLIDCTFVGNSTGGPFGGGAMYNGQSTATVTNCTFSGNSGDNGGAMYNSQSSLEITNCAFSGNVASGIAGDGGGAMFNGSNSNPEVTDCTFSGNWAVFRNGGGVHNDNSSPTITRCKFSGNSANFSGGGMFNVSNSHPTVVACTFSGNSAGLTGGGMRNVSNCSPIVTNCIFSGNTASEGGGMNSEGFGDPTLINCTFSGNSASSAGGGVFDGSSTDLTVSNCILWGNTPSQIQVENTSPVVSYSIVQGGWGGIDVFDVDPLYFDGDGPDNTPGTSDDNLRLLPASPAIDAGNNTAMPADTLDCDDDGNTTEPLPCDLDAESRFVDHLNTPDTGNPDPMNPQLPIVDMGAYEYSADCNGNGIQDECDVSCANLGGDCNVPDCGESSDCNTNGVPDECEPDCNDNGVPDDCDIDGGFEDCNANGVPDDCEIAGDDCDFDGILDQCQIENGSSEDCNNNTVPDHCEIAGDPDCNGNGTLDACDIAACPDGVLECSDCNLNGVPDVCDDPEDSIPDECVQFDGDCGAKEPNWSCAENWDGDVVPNNSEEATFSVTLAGEGDVALLDITVEINTLHIRSNAGLDIPAAGGDLTVVQPGGILVDGAVTQGDDRMVTSMGMQRIRPGGSYVVQDSDDAVSAQLSAGSLMLTGSGSSGLSGGTVSVEGASGMQIAGDLASSMADDKGSGTPPDFHTDGNATVAVGGDIIVDGAVEISYESAELLQLDGDFVNRSSAEFADIFDWFGPGGVAGVEMTGQGGPPGIQTIEAAGKDLGPCPIGLVDNFAFGVLRLAPNSIVEVVDTFDNQQDGAIACDEALYVDTLEISANATLITNDCRVYYSELIDEGGLISGLGLNVIQIISPADFDMNGTVDIVDLLELLAAWGPCGECESCPQDIDGDCNVGIDDLLVLLAEWS